MKPIRSMLANFVVNTVLKGFTYEEVFENLTPEMKDELAIKADAYVKDEFWVKFDRLIENLALNKMGKGATSQDEMMFAKMVMWYHETRRVKLKEIASWKSKDQTEPQKW